MKKYSICIDPAAARLYEAVAEKTGTSAERLMSAVLFTFAGRLAAKAAKEKQNPKN